LINVPYQDKCQACQTRASSHVLTFQLFPQDLRFGLEIEIVIPFGKRDGLTCESIAMLDAIQRIGIASNTSCGFHVHVDAEKGSMLSSLNAIKAICQSFVSVENALDVLVSDPKKIMEGERIKIDIASPIEYFLVQCQTSNDGIQLDLH
jgi:hypothetical protein